VRLTALEADNNLHPNYLVFVPALDDRPSIRPASIVHTATSFSAEFTTAAGLIYVVEYKNRLDDSQWQTLETISGDGTPKRFTDTATAGTRFYRIRVP
jgi:hypothetical protein